MAHKRFIYPFLILLLAASIGVVYHGVTAAPPKSPEASPPRSAAAIGDLYVVLNEVMPKPEAGEPAWVELYVGQELQFVFLPLTMNTAASTNLSSATLQPDASAPAVPWAGAAAAPVDLDGWQVTNEAGQIYTIPSNLPPLPRDVYVLIYFDGSGPAGNDYDPSDGKVVLHTPGGLTDIFPDEAGQVGLYGSGTPGPGNIVDFVAWGGYSESAAANAVAAGVWGAGEAVSFENGFGDISEEDILEPDESIGRYPGGRGKGAIPWANYPASKLTPGAANPVQPVLFVTPEDGAKVDASTLSLSWRQSAGATSYRFQLDDNGDFSSPLFDETTSNTYFKPQPALAPGVYFWRVNPLRSGLSSGWSSAFSIEAASASLAPGSEGLGPVATVEKVLGIARVRQNKDSRLLGLDGAPEGDPTTDLPENAWDAPAPCTEPPCTDTTKYLHGNQYCVRASIRMVASYYHSSASDILTMDRISYHILQEWSGNTRPGSNDATPDNDLGFNRGMYYPDEEDQGFSWALNISYTTPGGKPSFANVKTWINANRPIMFRNPGHMMVIDGYRETDGGDQYLHILDPDQPPDFERWQDYDTQTINGYWVGPTGGPANGQSRHDESSVWTDSDGDGIMNFDEVTRFSLDPYDVDTDGDWVADKKDMREYVFDNSGNYSFRSSDTDSDSLRKETDLDNDDDGTPDGCEDTNYNGKYESGLGETDNFNSGSSQACVPVFDILYPLKLEPENAGDPASPSKILVQVSTAVPDGWPLSLTASDFSVEIGGSAASVLSIYPSSDTYFLVVAPPTQSSAAFYDLDVSLSGTGSDSEANAVFYLPKNPSDEVIVLDRSGSMLSDDKIGAAQNAASAFVDFLNDGDWVGVTSFASSASTDYGLHEITAGSTVRTDAITAINGLTASGSTALGQGVQQGYGLLSGAAHGDHDWSLVLLSDGWENVPPYWAGVAPGITDTIVHTVALGEDADTTLLQSIAATKHGNYFYVDVNPPSVAALQRLAALPPPVLANTLPNRLADTYLAIGELNYGYQRLFERVAVAGTQDFLVDVPKGLPEVVFSLNWSDPAGQLAIALLQDPGANPVTPDAVYGSDTHEQWRVKNPTAGQWHVYIREVKAVDLMELLFTLSGKTETTLIAAVGGDPQERTVGVPVPIYGILTDSKPIAGAEVYALIAGKGVQQQGAGPQAAAGSTILQLFDDGNHGDGKPDDGLYANDLTGINAPGGYTVKLVAGGTNNAGETFLRYANTGFNVRPRAAYVWNDDLDTALEYEALLEKDHWVVDLVHLPAAAKTSFLPYELIIIGPDTGYLDNWGTPEAFSAIVQSETPVLGLGEGGYAFFGKLQLNIGWPNGAHGSGASINWASSGDEIWANPYNIVLPKEPLQLYEKPSTRVDINLPQIPAGVEVFGFNDANRVYANLVLENSWFMLWSFDDGPSQMTETGRKVFVNTTFRTVPWLP